MATDAPSAAAAPGSPPGERRGSARRASLQNLPPPSAEVLEQNRRETRRRSSVLGSMGLVGEPKEEKGKKPEDLVMTGVTRRGSEAAARPKLRRKSSLILSEKERKRLVSVAVTDSDEAKRASSAAFYDTNEPSIAFEASARPQPFSLSRADTADTIAKIKNAEVDVKMITGDHLNIAKELARHLLRDVEVVAGDHLDGDARAADIGNRRRRV